MAAARMRVRRMWRSADCFAVFLCGEMSRSQTWFVSGKRQKCVARDGASAAQWRVSICRLPNFSHEPSSRRVFARRPSRLRQRFRTAARRLRRHATPSAQPACRVRARRAKPARSSVRESLGPLLPMKSVQLATCPGHETNGMGQRRIVCRGHAGAAQTKIG